MITMRDAFFNRVFEYAKENMDIVVLTSDFSAPSFDRFRTELPGQFINTGILIVPTVNPHIARSKRLTTGKIGRRFRRTVFMNPLYSDVDSDGYIRRGAISAAR